MPKPILRNQCSVTFTFDFLTLNVKGHILNSKGVFVWRFIMIGVTGKQLWTKNHYQEVMHCDLDLWLFDSRSIEHIDSWGVSVWSFTMIDVKRKQSYDINQFQLSMHCDLKLWPLNPPIHRTFYTHGESLYEVSWW